MKEREIKRHINSVGETVQITKAMQMISASKMYKSNQRWQTSKIYLENVEQAIQLLMQKRFVNHPFFAVRDTKRVAYIVIASDKGLCSDYNHLVLNAAYEDMQTQNVVKIFAIGHTAREFFKRKGMPISNAYTHFMLNPFPEDSKIIANDLVNEFVEGKIDKLNIVFTNLMTSSSQNVEIHQLLPIPYKEDTDPILVETEKQFIDDMMLQYIWARVYYAISSSTLAENYKRMMAMQQATTNGEKLITQLQMDYNHKRQERITTELVDTSTSLQGKRL